jgi:hypothetical protein
MHPLGARDGNAGLRGMRPAPAGDSSEAFHQHPVYLQQQIYFLARDP